MSRKGIVSLLRYYESLDCLTRGRGSCIFPYMSNYRNDRMENISEMFKALSNPNRLIIFSRLISCCTPGTVCSADAGMRACVGELGQDIGIAPSTVSHHIKELRRAGLIRMKRRGRKVECWIDPDTLRDLAEFFSKPAGNQTI
jgi:DNA-binding transcriptional ArsR family regulator